MRVLHRLTHRDQMTSPVRRWLTLALALAVTIVALVSVNLAGCGRGGDFAPVGHTASNGQDVLILAPQGHLHLGRNSLRLRLTRAAPEQPLDVPAHLEFVLAVPGSAPLRLPVDLAKTGPGAFGGTANLEVPGFWWAEVTFDGIEGTQTVRVRVSVGR